MKIFNSFLIIYCLTSFIAFPQANETTKVADVMNYFSRSEGVYKEGETVVYDIDLKLGEKKIEDEFASVRFLALFRNSGIELLDKGYYHKITTVLKVSGISYYFHNSTLHDILVSYINTNNYVTSELHKELQEGISSRNSTMIFSNNKWFYDGNWREAKKTDGKVYDIVGALYDARNKIANGEKGHISYAVAENASMFYITVKYMGVVIKKIEKGKFSGKKRLVHIRVYSGKKKDVLVDVFMDPSHNFVPVLIELADFNVSQTVSKLNKTADVLDYKISAQAYVSDYYLSDIPKEKDKHFFRINKIVSILTSILVLLGIFLPFIIAIILIRPKLNKIHLIIAGVMAAILVAYFFNIKNLLSVLSVFVDVQNLLVNPYLSVVVAFVTSLIAYQILADKRRSILRAQIGKVNAISSSALFMFLGASIIVAVSTRLSFALNNPTVYVDEHAHISAAKSLIENGSFIYARAKIVTLLNAILYKIVQPSGYNDYVFWARIASIIVNSLTIIPIYLLAKKISTYAGLWSVFAWALAPAVIPAGTYTREYPYFVFLLLIAINCLVFLLDYFFRTFILLKQKPIIEKKEGQYRFNLFNFINKDIKSILMRLNNVTLIKLVLSLIFLSAYFSYAFLIDMNYSTIGMSLIIIFIFVFTYFFLNTKHWTNRGIVLGAILIISILPVLIGINNYATHLGDVFKPSLVWLRTYFPFQRTIISIWNETVDLFLILIIFAIGFMVIFIKRKNNIFISIFITFLFALAFYVFLVERYYKHRYIYILRPFFIILSISGISALYMFLNMIKNNTVRKAIKVIFVIIFLTSFNYSALYELVRGVSYTGDNFNYLSGENHVSTDVIFDNFSKSDFSNNNKIITTAYDYPLQIEFAIDTNRFIKYNSREAASNLPPAVLSCMLSQGTGYLFLDVNRHGSWAPRYFSRYEDTVFSNIVVKPIVITNEIEVYMWRHISSNDIKTNNF